MQVSTNGYFSFGTNIMYSKPELFSEYSPSSYVVAPFWAQNDISHRVGHVAYEIHDSENSGNYLSLVSTFISGHQQVHFNGTWMLLAEWNSVPQFQGSIMVVSVTAIEHKFDVYIIIAYDVSAH